MLENDPGMEIMKEVAKGTAEQTTNKLANAIGGLFPYWDLKGIGVDTFVTDIKNSNLPPVTKSLMISNAKKILKYHQRQTTIAELAVQAAKVGTDFSENSAVDDEWLERTMNAAKFVSDEKVQALWGQVIAREFEEPGSTPPSVIRILTEITPKYARAFQTLCSLGVFIVGEDENGNRSSALRIILPLTYKYLEAEGVSFDVLIELQMMGLIQYDGGNGFSTEFDHRIPKLHLLYGESAATIDTIEKYDNRALPIGYVILTEAGNRIGRVTTAREIPGHFEAVCHYMVENGVRFKEKPEIRADEFYKSYCEGSDGLKK